MATILSLVAAGTSMLGAITLLRRWREGRGGSTVLAVAGWVLLFAALALWVVAHGVEFGTVLGLTVPTLAAFIVIASHADFRHRAIESERRVVAPLTLDRIGYHHLLFVLAVPFAGIASLCIAPAVALALPWQPANQWALAIMLLPVIWGGASTWLTFDPNVPRAAGSILLLAAAATAFLAFGVA